MTKKDLAIKVLFNLLKMWGSSWLAFALVILPFTILRAIVKEVDSTKDLHNFWNLLVVGLVACIFIFFFSRREAYKEAHIPQTRLFMVLGAVLPTVLYIFINIITFGNVYLCCLPILMAEILAKGTENIRMVHIFLSTLMFYPFFSVSLLLGTIFGRKKRAKDKEKLTSQQSEH